MDGETELYARCCGRDRDSLELDVEVSYGPTNQTPSNGPLLYAHDSDTAAATSDCAAALLDMSGTALALPGQVQASCLLMGNASGKACCAAIEETDVSAETTATFRVECPPGCESGETQPVFQGTFNISAFDDGASSLRTAALLSGPGIYLTADHSGIFGYRTDAAGYHYVYAPGASGYAGDFQFPASCGGTITLTAESSVDVRGRVCSGDDDEIFVSTPRATIGGSISCVPVADEGRPPSPSIFRLLCTAANRAATFPRTPYEAKLGPKLPDGARDRGGEIFWCASRRGASCSMHLKFAFGVCLALGLFARAAALATAVGFTWLFLIERCTYQNHYYLLMLVAWAAVALPLGRTGRSIIGD